MKDSLQKPQAHYSDSSCLFIGFRCGNGPNNEAEDGFGNHICNGVANLLIRSRLGAFETHVLDDVHEGVREP